MITHTQPDGAASTIDEVPFKILNSWEADMAHAWQVCGWGSLGRHSTEGYGWLGLVPGQAAVQDVSTWRPARSCLQVRAVCMHRHAGWSYTVVCRVMH